jgi:phosphatidate cytidylyltransferase
VTEARADLNAVTELKIRIASAIVLITAVILAVIGGPYAFAVLVAACAVAALYEWHRLVNAGRAGWEIVPSILTIFVVIALTLTTAPWGWSVVAIVAGALTTAIAAAGRRSWVLWHSVGVIYIGVPVLSLIALHENFPNGGFVVVGVFVAVWTADSAALFVGRLFGGPLLAPNLSPKKTWAGLIGGVLLAAIAEAVYVGFLGESPLYGGALGFFIGVVANAGDLFESWVKRVFRMKNSGNLIPGHGGMLDRIDSLLFAAPAAMAFLYFAGSDSLFGSNL